MTSTQIAVIAIVVIAVMATAIMILLRNRTKKLRAQFGPEYDRAVAETGNKFKAEAELQRVEKRVRNYPVRPISSTDRGQFQQAWRMIQGTFVDDPGGALTEADLLLAKVMDARGYPPSDFENRAVEISVDHATVVDHYRAGHEIAVWHSHRQATTEDLRKGMIHYRALFDELIEGESVPMRARAAGQS
jgi:hypothetical protein